jgi:CheY-like chemotaxis protein
VASRPADLVRLGTAIAVGAHLLVVGWGVTLPAPPPGAEWAAQLGAAAVCGAAFLASRSRPRLAAIAAIAAVLAELLLAIGRLGLSSVAAAGLPLVVSSAGLLLGARASVAVAAVAAVAVPLSAALHPAPYAAYPPGLFGFRLLVLEVIVAAAALITWTVVRAYAATLADERREAAERLALEERLRHAQLGGTERILLVEDDPHVRRLAKRVLDHAGYRVAEADSAAAALAAFPGLADTRLLLTDVAMPGMSGIELAAELRRTAPALEVLYMSGYFDTSLADPSIDPAHELVEKPFSPDALLRKVRAALDRAARGPPA